MSMAKGIDISALALEASLTAMKGTGWTVESLKAVYDAIIGISSSGIALESTLTTMKGVGWTNETLKAIKDAVDTITIDPATIWGYTTRTLSDYSGVWSVATRALTDKAGFTISGTKTTLDALNDLSLATIEGSIVIAKEATSTAIKAKTDLIVAGGATEANVTTKASQASVDIIDGIVDDIKTETLTHPTLVEIEASATLAKEATFTHATYGLDKIKTETAAIKAKTDLIPDTADAGNLTHDITTVNDKTETQIVEIAKTGIYALSIFFDLDVLETAVEGGTVTVRLYNKVDGTNYSDKPSAYLTYVVGLENEYPSIEANMVHGNCKITIQCSTDVTATRTIAYRYIVRDLGT